MEIVVVLLCIDYLNFCRNWKDGKIHINIHLKKRNWYRLSTRNATIISIKKINFNFNRTLIVIDVESPTKQTQ